MGNLKDAFDMKMMTDLGSKIKDVYPIFDEQAYAVEVFSGDWEQSEMFGRLSRMAVVLGRMLPDDYAKALQIIYVVLPACKNIMMQDMVFPQFVVEYGMDYLEESAEAMEMITQHTSCEWAVRPFIDKYPERMFDILMRWARSEIDTVRRLASEGTRYAIPWGGRLLTIKKRADYAIPILELLKNDPCEVVCTSVANNLNELSKIAPDLVVQIAHEWVSGTKNTQKIVKHACRTMLKKGYPPVMELFGLSKPEGISVDLLSVSKRVKVNDELHFSFEIENDSGKDVKVRIGYDIGFLKSNGRMNYKENRISERSCKPGKTQVERKHKISETSGRKIFVGGHDLRITINGCTMAEAEFTIYE